MQIDSAELLEEILRRAEQSVLPTLRKSAESLIDIFNHDSTQRRIKQKLEEVNIKAYSKKLQEITHRCKISASLFDKLRNLKDLLQNIDKEITKSEVTSFLTRLSNTGFVGLVTDDTFGFLTDIKLDINQKIVKFFKFLEVGSESNIENNRQIFEEYISSWKANSKKRRLPEENIMRTERELRAEFDKATLQNCELISQDQFLNEIKSRFESLRRVFRVLVVTRENHSQGALSVYSTVRGNPKATGARIGAAAGIIAVLPVVIGPILAVPFVAAGTFTGFKVGAITDTAEMNRRSINAERAMDSNWFNNMSDYIVEYLKGRQTDGELLNFIIIEKLDPFLDHFNALLDPWLEELEKKLRQLENLLNKSYKLPKELVLREIERMWRFIRAVILNDPDLADEHQRMMNDMIRDAANIQSPDSQTSLLPWISFGQLPLPDESNQRVVRFKCVLSNSIGRTANEVVNGLKTIFENVQHASTTNENGISVIEMNIKIKDNVASKIARLMSKLADLQVRGVLIGEFGLGNFRHAMNPAYNRIYSLNGVDKAEGFISTYYSGSLNRGGEPYFCPNGWRRYSIDVGLTGVEFERKYRDWHVAYHGTEGHVAMAVLLSGIRASGHGCFINEGKGEGAVYLSPSIEYSGHPRYAGVWQVKDKYVQMVLQVRVNRNLVFQKKPGTLLGAYPDNPRLDPNFPDNNELEWVIKWPPGTNITTLNGILVYGIMLRVTDQHPKNLPQNAWWATPPRSK